MTPSRIAISALLLACLCIGGCGSSTSTSATAPSGIPKCDVALSLTSATVPAQGGIERITVTTARECQWSAQIEGTWLSLRTPPSGQGDGMVEVAATSNPDPQNRRGAVVLNTKRVDIIQAPGECVITLAESAASFSPAGGSGQADVRASSQLCTWTAASDSDWISIRSATGRGSAPVVFDVAPTAGPPRSGQLTIAEQRFSVTQSEGCTFTIAPVSHTAPPSGGASTIAVTTTAACPWTAASNADWISIVQGSVGTGPGIVSFSVEPAGSVARTGTLVVAGQVFSVTQPPAGPGPSPGPPPPAPCAFVVAPASHNFGATGGSGTVTITAGNGCPWTASTAAPWISIQPPTSGSGSGSVTFNVAATTGPPRTGTLTIGGQTITVTQSQGCSFSISPETQSVPAGGGSGNVAVTAAGGCAWTASSNAPWLTISSGESGSGNGTVRFAAASTTGPSRSGSLTIAGRTFTVNQGQGCTFTLQPSSANVPASGAQVEFDLRTEAGCAWTASESTPFMSVSTSTLSGTGSGRVRFAVLLNTGPARSGVVTAGGQPFNVTQESGCSYALSGSSQNVDAAGGSGTVGVTTAGGCAWTAASQADWITISSGASGSGNGSVSFLAAPNPGAPRSGTLTIGGSTFTINQGQSCAFSIAPEQRSIGSEGGTADVSVQASNGCSWTASTDTPWMSLASNATGVGNGSVRFAVQANPGPLRTGTATIAGRTFTITQQQACAFSIAPEQQSVDTVGGTATVTVTADIGCSWTAVSQAPWISIASGASGSGTGTVQLAAEANPGAPRSGTATIAGRTFTINQGQACAFDIDPDQQSFDAAGGGATVNVTTAIGCAWTASSEAPWISVPPGASGSGNGSVAVTVQANTGAPRTGIARIAGLPFTVSQGSGCNFTVTPENIPASSAGGPIRVDVRADSDCSWTASPVAPWITINAGSSGTGNGTVEATVGANAGPARTGVLTVAGKQVTVSQDSGCGFALSAASQAMPTAGGPGNVTVTTGAECAWTAVSQASWITVTAGAAMTGTGVVQFTVEPNATGAARSGTITIAGQTFTVNQE